MESGGIDDGCSENAKNVNQMCSRRSTIRLHVQTVPNVTSLRTLIKQFD